MREEPIRSLLLLDTDADERRLISAIASRAGWSVVGAADERAPPRLLQGPHGRDVRAALLGSWDTERSPQLIAALRAKRGQASRSSSLATATAFPIAVDAMRAGASDFLVRPVAPERLIEALAANADRREAAGELAPVSEKLAPELALEQLVGAAPRIPRRACRRRQGARATACRS